jgi:hypothetical protein
MKEYTHIVPRAARVIDFFKVQKTGLLRCEIDDLKIPLLHPNLDIHI